MFNIPTCRCCRLVFGGRWTFWHEIDYFEICYRRMRPTRVNTTAIWMADNKESFKKAMDPRRCYVKTLKRSCVNLPLSTARPTALVPSSKWWIQPINYEACSKMRLECIILWNWQTEALWLHFEIVSDENTERGFKWGIHEWERPDWLTFGHWLMNGMCCIRLHVLYWNRLWGTVFCMPWNRYMTFISGGTISDCKSELV